MDMNNDGIVDLTEHFLGRVRFQLDLYLTTAKTNSPKGAAMLREWIDEAAGRYDSKQLANMLYQAEQNGDFDLTEPQVYEEAEAAAVINKVLSYLVIEDEFGFDWGVKDSAEDDDDDDEYKFEFSANLFGHSQAKSFTEALEQNESIAGLGTAYKEGADIELPFEKYKRKHNK